MTSLRARRIVDAVIFDLDGVIVDSRVPFARSVNAALAAHDLPTRPHAELHGYLGLPSYTQMLWTAMKKRAAYLPGC